MKIWLLPEHTLERCSDLLYMYIFIYRYYNWSFLLSWTQVICALRPVYTVENKQETWGHLNVESTGALINQGWGQSCFQKENCICAATIQVQYIQFLVIYQSVCTYKQFFTSKFDPNSDRQWLLYRPSFSVTTMFSSSIFFFVLYMYSVYMHKKCVCMSRIYASNLHHRPRVVTGWLLCDLRWNGTQFIKKRVGRESYFYPQNYYTLTFVRSRASSTGK